MIYDKYIYPCSPQQQEMQNILNNDANDDDDDLELNQAIQESLVT